MGDSQVFLNKLVGQNVDYYNVHRLVHRYNEILRIK